MMKRTVLLLLVYALWHVIAHGQNMNDSTVVLNEVVVKSIAPKTKLRGDAIVTKVQGSALEKSGSLHELGLNARWSWLLGSLSYSQSDHMISQWQYPFISEQIPAEEGVLVYRRINLPKPVRTLISYVNASPTFGPYTMNWTVGFSIG